MEHPLVVTMLNDAKSLPSSTRALICQAANGLSQGMLVILKVNVQSKGGKNTCKIIRIGVSQNGERLTKLERFREFSPIKVDACSLDVATLIEPARNILQRQMEYEGVIPEGASYSVTPLAVLLFQTAFSGLFIKPLASVVLN